MIYPPLLPTVTTSGDSAPTEARLEVVEAAVMMKFYDLRKRLCEERDISDLHCSGPGDDTGTVQITAFTRRIEVRPGVRLWGHKVNILTFTLPFLNCHPQFWHRPEEIEDRMSPLSAFSLHHLLSTGITYMLGGPSKRVHPIGAGFYLQME